MKGMKKQRKIIFRVVALLGCVLLVVVVNYYHWQTFQHAREIGLIGFIDTWKSEGCPSHSENWSVSRKLGFFMTNRVFAVDGTNFTAQFVRWEEDSDYILFANKDEYLLWVSSSGKVMGKPKKHK